MILQTTNDPPASYGRVRDSIEAYGMSRPTYNEKLKGKKNPDPKVLGLPDTWRINPVTKGKKPQGVQMTCDFQFWIYRINVERQLGQPFDTEQQFCDFYQKELDAWKSGNGGNTINSFNSIFRSDASHVNHAGVDVRANHITGANLDQDDPMFSNIVTGRWVFPITDIESHSFKVINAQQGFLQFNPWDNPELFDQPLNTGRIFKPDSPKGSPIILRDDIRRAYSQFEGKAVMPVILPEDDYAVFQDARLKIPSETTKLLSKF